MTKALFSVVLRPPTRHSSSRRPGRCFDGSRRMSGTSSSDSEGTTTSTSTCSTWPWSAVEAPLKMRSPAESSTNGSGSTNLGCGRCKRNVMGLTWKWCFMKCVENKANAKDVDKSFKVHPWRLQDLSFHRHVWEFCQGPSEFCSLFKSVQLCYRGLAAFRCIWQNVEENTSSAPRVQICRDSTSIIWESDFWSGNLRVRTFQA